MTVAKTTRLKSLKNIYHFELTFKKLLHPDHPNEK